MPSPRKSTTTRGVAVTKKEGDRNGAVLSSESPSKKRHPGRDVIVKVEKDDDESVKAKDIVSVSGEPAVGRIAESRGVSRKVAPKARPATPVKQFGSVDSDDDMVVHVADAPPKVATRVPPAVAARNEKQGIRITSNSSDDDTRPQKPAREYHSSVTETPCKRRAVDDDNDSPSKIRVKDLTLSPRKTSAVEESTGQADDGIAARAGQRNRKPTRRAANDEGASIDLLSRLNAVESDDDIAGDDVGRPSSPRKRGSTRRKDGVKKAESFVEDEPDQGSDVSMHSVGRGKGKMEPIQFRPVTDTDDELPSPSLIFSRQKKAVVGSMKKQRSPSASPTLTDVEEQYAKRRQLSDQEKEKEGERVEGDKYAVKGEAGRNALDVVVGKGKSVKGKEVDRSARRDECKELPLEKSTGSALAPSTDTYSVRNEAVFSTAIEIPEEDDEDGFDDDLEIGAARGPVATPLLDRERIHPDLLELYDSLDWTDSLRRARFIGYSNNEDAFDDFIPVSYGSLIEKVIPRVRSKLIRSVLFVEYKDFKSPVRVPLMTFVRSWECIRVPHAQGNHNSAFVLTGVCHRSFVGQGREVGESYVKQLHVRPLENNWEIFQCNLGTYYNDSRMHAPGRYSALVFQTKRQGWSPRKNDKDSDKLASTPYSSPKKAASSSQSTGEPSSRRDKEDASDNGRDIAKTNILHAGPPPYRLFDEGIPVYDGRTSPGTKGFQFGANDWERYHELPLYPYPEVEEGSLVTVVFTITGFRGSTNPHHTVHFNALIAIVLGKIDM